MRICRAEDVVEPQFCFYYPSLTAESRECNVGQATFGQLLDETYSADQTGFFEITRSADERAALRLRLRRSMREAFKTMPVCCESVQAAGEGRMAHAIVRYTLFPGTAPHACLDTWGCEQALQSVCMRTRG